MPTLSPVPKTGPPNSGWFCLLWGVFNEITTMNQESMKTLPFDNEMHSTVLC